MNIAGKISIVIPCYNHGSVLEETLSSIERVRNGSVHEVIIVNDGSTDPETCKLFEKLANSEYKIIHQQNRGVGPARNAAIAIAGGEFILPLDSDNRIRETYLTRGTQLLLENPRIGVVYGNAEYFGKKTGIWEVPGFDIVRLIEGNYIDACALYRKSVWESINGYDEKMPWMGYEDWDFWQRVVLQGWQFHHLKEIAFDYRVSGVSMSTRETIPHEQDLRGYISGKRENNVLQFIFNQEIEIRRLKKAVENESARLTDIERSFDYRLGRKIAAPLRKFKRFFNGKA
jgi:glycosyltransferase involved in cell wall biosynthesis